MTTKKWMIVFASVFIAGNNNVSAQVEPVIKENSSVKNSDPLKGLKKVSFKDIDSDKPIMMDPNSTPMYTESLALINEENFGPMMMSGDYTPEPYVDSNNDIKAFVLRKATEEEKVQRKQMQSEMQKNREGKNELIGKTALPFSVTDILGNKYSLEELKGKVIVINFWFVECKPCVMEMPELNQLVEKYKGKDVVFLGFSTNKKAKIEEFLKRKKFNYNLIADSEKIADLYGVKSFPTSIIIDKNSTVSHYVSGYNPESIEDIDNVIETLLK